MSKIQVVIDVNLNKKLIAVLVVAVVLASTITYYYLIDDTYTLRPQVSQYAIEYPMRDSSSVPNAIAVDSSGNLWFTLMNSSSLAELNPSNGLMHQYRIPTGADNGTTSWGLVIDNSRELVWFTEQATNSVWSFNMRTHHFTRYLLKTQFGFPFGIALDNQGNIWFTEFFGNKIGEITASGNMTEIAIPRQGYTEPSGITVGPLGRIWFTIPGVSEIVSYYHGQFSFQNLTGLVLDPVGISLDQEGDIWMTQHGPNFITEFNPSKGIFKTISTTIPPEGSSLPYFDHVDQNGNVWFNEHNGNAMSEFFPSNNTLVEYFIPTRISVMGNISGMLTSALSPSGAPWYTEFFAGKVGTINTSGTLDLHLTLSNYTKPILISENSSVNLQLILGGSAASIATVKAEVGNFSSNISYNYSKVGQSITLTTEGTNMGVYLVTVSAITSAVSYSKIIELEVL